MLLTITIFGIKWFYLLLFAGIAITCWRFTFPPNYNPKDPTKVKELLDSQKEMGTEHFDNYNQARFKKYKELSQNPDVKLEDIEDKLGEGVVISDKGKLVIDVWTMFRPNE